MSNNKDIQKTENKHNQIRIKDEDGNEITIEDNCHIEAFGKPLIVIEKNGNGY